VAEQEAQVSEVHTPMSVLEIIQHINRFTRENRINGLLHRRFAAHMMTDVARRLSLIHQDRSEEDHDLDEAIRAFRLEEIEQERQTLMDRLAKLSLERGKIAP
jgi:glucan phosphorylase